MGCVPHCPRPLKLFFPQHLLDSIHARRSYVKWRTKEWRRDTETPSQRDFNGWMAGSQWPVNFCPMLTGAYTFDFVLQQVELRGYGNFASGWRMLVPCIVPGLGFTFFWLGQTPMERQLARQDNCLNLRRSMEIVSPTFFTSLFW